jgi:hypothetical protein
VSRAGSLTGVDASCTGSVSFVNSSGAIIGAATSFMVGSGQIFSASLPFARTAAAVFLGNEASDGLRGR